MANPINDPKRRALFDALRQLKEGDVLTRRNVHDINRLVVHADYLVRHSNQHRDVDEVDEADADVSRIEGFRIGRVT